MSEQTYVNRPKLSEKEMQTKLDDIRNSVGKKMQKWADKIQFSMHYIPKIERFEGEKWVENGKTWVMRNGVKTSISLLQDARMPWWCPRCNSPMNHRFDRKFYFLRGHCFNCNIEIEGKMRLDGTWEEFERRTVRENEKSFLQDKIQEHLDYMRTFKVPQLHFSDGRWEELAKLGDFEDMFKTLEDDIELMIARLEAIKQEEENESENIKSDSDYMETNDDGSSK